MAKPTHDMASPIGARMIVQGREMDYFCGTSYYALHGHPGIIEAAIAATRLYGIGPATLAGVPVYAEIVDLVRQWFETESASYVTSGYLGMTALLAGLRDDFDVIFVDAASHYSVYDALVSTQKPVFPFRHCDAQSLAETLSANLQPGQVPVVVSDGVFPSTGALPPLADYAEILKHYDRALLCLDDSHGVGVIGAHGRGALEHFGIEGEGHYRSGTLSKAVGGFGGIVPGSEILVDKIRHNAGPMSGASLPPVPAAAAAVAGMRMLAAHPEMRHTLWRNVKHLRDGLRGLGLAVDDTPVPIVSVRAGADLEAVRLALEGRDIAVKRVAASGYSDAPEVETLRIAVFSTHTPAQLDRLLGTLAELL